jgi:hypothetical protein
MSQNYSGNHKRLTEKFHLKIDKSYEKKEWKKQRSIKAP